MTSISLEEARLVIEEDRLKQEMRRARREKVKAKFLSLLKTQELHAEIARRKERTCKHCYKEFETVLDFEKHYELKHTKCEWCGSKVHLHHFANFTICALCDMLT